MKQINDKFEKIESKKESKDTDLSKKMKEELRERQEQELKD